MEVGEVTKFGPNRWSFQVSVLEGLSVASVLTCFEPFWGRTA